MIIAILLNTDIVALFISAPPCLTPPILAQWLSPLASRKGRLDHRLNALDLSLTMLLE